MRVVVQFNGYNTRRYSRPWIAKVVKWETGKQPEIAFGANVGLEVEIDANPGDVVRWGQKDMRGNATVSEWGIVSTGGEVVNASPETARAHWVSAHDVKRGEDGFVFKRGLYRDVANRLA